MRTAGKIRVPLAKLDFRGGGGVFTLLLFTSIRTYSNDSGIKWRGKGYSFQWYNFQRALWKIFSVRAMDMRQSTKFSSPRAKSQFFATCEWGCAIHLLGTDNWRRGIYCALTVKKIKGWPLFRCLPHFCRMYIYRVMKEKVWPAGKEKGVVPDFRGTHRQILQHVFYQSLWFRVIKSPSVICTTTKKLVGVVFYAQDDR